MRASVHLSCGHRTIVTGSPPRPGSWWLCPIDGRARLVEDIRDVSEVVDRGLAWPTDSAHVFETGVGGRFR